MFSGFREFIMRGNVIDLAVAVVIGAAFGAVVTSFVEDILTPLIGIFGADSLENLTVDIGPAVLRYGEFLTALISFLLVAAAIYFFVVQPMNALEARRQRGADETPTTKTCTECASEIPYTARRCPMCTQPQAAD
ncbi:MAG: large conductance mechanosensitive channel protein MscL [Chloroflexota bacterium]|nr:large conductance mechanosensitive channel protein MscL [Chloroflexota bacterium]